MVWTSKAYATAVAEPRDVSPIRHPRIGYTGVIKKQLDWPLILELARRHREWSFVFVGPKSPHPEILAAIKELSRRTNVYLLDGKSIREPPAYPQHFDACFMPYRVNEYTNNIYPLKLHEYLASGTPIVSSPIRSLRDFSSTVALAKSADEWSLALIHALEPVVSSPEVVAARQKIAREHDWGRLIYSLAQIFCDRLGSEYAEQFAKLNIFNNGLCHPK
jgi:glycosyltransferase involved in cell wall biosynthesis